MIILDIEASGTNYEKHSILAIGALDLAHPENQFYDECHVWDGAHIDDEALAVAGFSREEATDTTKKSEAEIVKAFIAWSQDLPDHTFAGQNVSFDRDFIKAACERGGIDYPFAHRSIDTHTLCYMHMAKRGLTPPLDVRKRRSALNITAALDYCGIPDERGEAHNALYDTYIHAELVARLLYDKKLLPDFAQYDIPWQRA